MIHVTNSLHALKNLRKLSDENFIINFGNDDKVQVEHIGVISLFLSFDHALKLKKKFIYVTFTRCNLIYVAAFGP